MNNKISPISLVDIYSRKTTPYLGKWNLHHQQEVEKFLKKDEIIYFAWWWRLDGISAGDILYNYLGLLTNLRLIAFKPRQFDEKSIVLDTYIVNLENCERVFLTQKGGGLFSSPYYVIQVDYDHSNKAHWVEHKLIIYDKFYTQDEIENIAKFLEKLTAKAKNKTITSTSINGNSIVDKIRDLFAIYKSGGLDEEQYKSAMQKLLDENQSS